MGISQLIGTYGLQINNLFNDSNIENSVCVLIVDKHGYSVK